jgi:hypothetical protein
MTNFASFCDAKKMSDFNLLANGKKEEEKIHAEIIQAKNNLIERPNCGTLVKKKFRKNIKVMDLIISLKRISKTAGG